MSSFVDKLLHFAVGLAVGIAFWWILERYLRSAARVINPILFLITLVWGASGLFFFRKLGIPGLSHTFFYMAFPDWDIPLYKATGLKLLIHRSWLFHSILIPMALLGVWLWLSRVPSIAHWQRSLLTWLRDGAIGLSVGVSAHLLWDALLSSLRRGFYIHGFNSAASHGWLLINLLAGIGIPLLVASALGPSRNSKNI
ncbi:hypothetical protein PN498_27675 [Oscillatoria sp. CS-180]|uniref:hypothetical protein n=1 Tax=Oscillatoria sp. CS-180 TaxID=3021720 RepID=UPI00232F3E3C|nr:hypothetical protein [Oscillatoria sp. CS-180]MDB9529798.1 hypothetical protein [Oscillatoria sp. CS-180]